MQIKVIVAKEEVQSFIKMNNKFAALLNEEQHLLEDVKGKAGATLTKYAHTAAKFDDKGELHMSVDVDPELLNAYCQNFSDHAPAVIKFAKAAESFIKSLEGLKGLFEAQWQLFKDALTFVPSVKKEEKKQAA